MQQYGRVSEYSELGDDDIPGLMVKFRARWVAASLGRFTMWSAGRMGSPTPANMSSTGGCIRQGGVKHVKYRYTACQLHVKTKPFGPSGHPYMYSLGLLSFISWFPDLSWSFWLQSLQLSDMCSLCFQLINLNVFLFAKQIQFSFLICALSLSN